MFKFLITCPRGLEEVTAKDITPYVLENPIKTKGGVFFKGNLETMYKINLYSRTGMYLLKNLFEFKADNFNDVYSSVFKFHWEKIILTNQSFSIRTKVKSKIFENSGFATLKIKDAIVDRIKKNKGQRPNINKINPEVKIFIYIRENSFSVYIDSSGRPLFMRGYRSKIHKASLNECLAAGIILLSNWDKKSSFYDPMCGSGTIPIEAAMIAFNIPPGILRDRYAFKLWKDYDAKLFLKIKENSKKKINYKSDIMIYGSDIVKKNIKLSIESSQKINLGKFINFKVEDVSDFCTRNNYGTVIVNPPYGIRLGTEENLQKLYKTIGDIFKNNCIGHDTYIFTHNKNLAKFVGLRTKKKSILKNGQLDCRLLYYPIKKGNFK